MEIIPEGKHFRLVHESELPEILVTLERFLPESLKVRMKNSNTTLVLFLFCIFISLVRCIPNLTPRYSTVATPNSLR